MRIKHGEPSYSVNELKAIHAHYLYFHIGRISPKNIKNWRLGYFFEVYERKQKRPMNLADKVLLPWWRFYYGVLRRKCADPVQGDLPHSASSLEIFSRGVAMYKQTHG